MITGESRPVPKSAGNPVVAGTVATDSALRVQVEAVGEDTALAGIQRLVAQAESSRGRAQVLADRFAALLLRGARGGRHNVRCLGRDQVPGSSRCALSHSAGYRVPARPGLAIPLVIALSTALAARAGILVKDRLALERMRKVDAVLFDKTGTLTRGAHVVTGVVAAEGGSTTDVLRIAGAVESDSEHPLAGESGVPPATKAMCLWHPSSGRSPDEGWDRRRWTAHACRGGLDSAAGRVLEIPSSIETSTAHWRLRGASILYLFQEDRVIGAIALEDGCARRLTSRGRTAPPGSQRIALITGDARQVAAQGLPPTSA